MKKTYNTPEIDVYDYASISEVTTSIGGNTDEGNKPPLPPITPFNI